MEYSFIKNCYFYVNEGEVALEVFDEFKADKVVYDGKNTLVLFDGDKGCFIVKNILPNIRKLLKDDVDLLVIHSKDDEIEDVYELKIKVNKDTIFKDDFYEKAQEFFEKVYQEAKVIAE